MAVLSIVGLTATGKTSLAHKALELLNQPVHFLSADSRQVYADLPVTTGADLPSGAQELNLHGVAFLDLDQEWSAGQFRELGWQVFRQAEDDWGDVVVVGGTGLYHQALWSTDVGWSVPPNLKLRSELDKLGVLDLQNKLKKQNLKKFSEMNQSDQLNPRRLIRAIELEMAELPEINPPDFLGQWQQQGLTIGLTASNEWLAEKISQRVDARFELALKEVTDNLDSLRGNSPAATSTGVRELMALIEGQLGAEECRHLWIQSELQYAKRQKTWWQKTKGIVWHDVFKKDWRQTALDRISIWRTQLD